jgi:hypothetical protein
LKPGKGFLFFAENYGVHPARHALGNSPNGIPGKEKAAKHPKYADPAAVPRYMIIYQARAPAAVFQKARFMILHKHSRNNFKFYAQNLLTFKKKLDNILGVKRFLDSISK